RRRARQLPTSSQPPAQEKRRNDREPGQERREREARAEAARQRCAHRRQQLVARGADGGVVSASRIVERLAQIANLTGLRLLELVPQAERDRDLLEDRQAGVEDRRSGVRGGLGPGRLD